MSQFCYVPCFDRQLQFIFRLDFIPRYHQGSDEELHKKLQDFFFLSIQAKKKNSKNENCKKFF